MTLSSCGCVPLRFGKIILFRCQLVFASNVLLHIFAAVSQRPSPVPLLHSSYAWECLTFADLCPSRFTRNISTLRMTASTNCTSVCPLTQEQPRLLSKVRSSSDYNPFPSLLWVLFVTSWQQLFQLISLEIAGSQGDGDIAAVTLPQSAILYLIALQTRSNWRHCISVNRSQGETAPRGRGVKGVPMISVLLGELLKVSTGPNLLKRLI